MISECLADIYIIYIYMLFYLLLSFYNYILKVQSIAIAYNEHVNMKTDRVSQQNFNPKTRPDSTSLDPDSQPQFKKKNKSQQLAMNQREPS